MKFYKTRYLIITGVFLIAATLSVNVYAQNSQAGKKGDLSAQIEDIYAAMGKAVMDKDAATLASYFAEDVYFKLPGQPPVQSRMGVQKVHEGMFGQGMSVRFETTELKEYGNVAVEVGEADIYAPDGSVAAKAVYLTNWKKINGKWLIYRDVVSALPAE